MERFSSKHVMSQFGDIKVYNFPMTVNDVIKIYYVAVRGRDEVKGAVQRILNPRRIESIANFVLEGNMFVNTFVLNWTNKKHTPVVKKDKIILPIIQNSAQVIDGQHRIEGLREAIKKDASIGEKQIFISLCLDLKTKDAANIFLNINTEQKPVPKSLVYDLYGIVIENKDLAINRATDIARELNDNSESPYYGRIKFPGKENNTGVIDLSTVVGSLKQHLEPDGKFYSVNLKSFQYQKDVIFNYFNSLKDFYSRKNLWDKKNQNPFLRNSGFHAAIEHLAETILPQCAPQGSFKQDKMKEIMGLDRYPLLLHDTIKGMDGKTARKAIRQYLNSNAAHSLPDEMEYAI